MCWCERESGAFRERGFREKDVKKERACAVISQTNTVTDRDYYVPEDSE